MKFPRHCSNTGQETATKSICALSNIFRVEEKDFHKPIKLMAGLGARYQDDGKTAILCCIYMRGLVVEIKLSKPNNLI